MNRPIIRAKNRKLLLDPLEQVRNLTLASLASTLARVLLAFTPKVLDKDIVIKHRLLYSYMVLTLY